MYLAEPLWASYMPCLLLCLARCTVPRMQQVLGERLLMSSSLRVKNSSAKKSCDFSQVLFLLWALVSPPIKHGLLVRHS